MKVHWGKRFALPIISAQGSSDFPVMELNIERTPLLMWDYCCSYLRNRESYMFNVSLEKKKKKKNREPCVEAKSLTRHCLMVKTHDKMNI